MAEVRLFCTIELATKDGNGWQELFDMDGETRRPFDPTDYADVSTFAKSVDTAGFYEIGQALDYRLLFENEIEVVEAPYVIAKSAVPNTCRTS